MKDTKWRQAVLIDAEIHAELKKLAQMETRSMSAEIEHLIEQRLKELLAT